MGAPISIDGGTVMPMGETNGYRSLQWVSPIGFYITEMECPHGGMQWVSPIGFDITEMECPHGGMQWVSKI